MQGKIRDVGCLSATKAVEWFLYGETAQGQREHLHRNSKDKFVWVDRNKVYSMYYGKPIVGKNSMTAEEVAFLHSKKRRIAALHLSDTEKLTETQGVTIAQEIKSKAYALGLPVGSIFLLNLDENEKMEMNCMRKFAGELLETGYFPGVLRRNCILLFDSVSDRPMRRAIWTIVSAWSYGYLPDASQWMTSDMWVSFIPSRIVRDS